MSYMGFTNIDEDTKLNTKEIIRLATMQGHKYKLLSGGKVRIFDITPSDGKTFSDGVRAGTLGGWFGYAKGGTNVTKDFRKTGMFYK
tara:strand:+ start:110 stop:370 length:261 start_codon:yes stop_codon:yes gene_type:complete